MHTHRERRVLAPIAILRLTPVGEERTEQRAVAQLHERRMPVIGRRVDQRHRLAPGSALVGRAYDHRAAAGGRDDVGRKAQLAIFLKRLGRIMQRSGRRRMPVTGVETDEPVTVLESYWRFPADKSAVAGERVGLIDARPNKRPTAILGPRPGLTAFEDPHHRTQ